MVKVIKMMIVVMVVVVVMMMMMMMMAAMVVMVVLVIMLVVEVDIKSQLEQPMDIMQIPIIQMISLHFLMYLVL